MVTYPNQKVIHINKPQYSENFLSVGNSEWQNACNNLTYNAFKLYLYLAGNADGFDLALSKVAVQNRIKMSDNTYTTVVKELREKDYIIQKQGNIYEFYTTPYPQQDGIPHLSSTVSPNATEDYTPTEDSIIPQQNSGEIDNISKINKLSKNATAQKETEVTSTERKKRMLTDLSEEELKNLKADYKKKTNFPELYKKYDLCMQTDDGEYILTKTLIKDIDELLSARKKASSESENLVALKKFNLTLEEANELTKNIFDFCDSWTKMGSSAEKNMRVAEDYFKLSARNLLLFIQEHPLSTYSTYREYIPSHIWDIKNRKTKQVKNPQITEYYEDYWTYLSAFIVNPDTITQYAELCIEEKKKNERI